MSTPFLPSAIFFLACAASLQGQTPSPLPAAPPRVLVQIEQRAPALMSAADLQFLADRRAAVASAMAASGYDLQQGSWTYEQSVCPLFPGTMLLRYDSSNGPGHGNRVVAVLDRQSGEVRVAPTLRDGSTPFHQSYKNETTYSIFNQILAREGVSIRNPALLASGRWVKLALCYAALSGEQPTTLLTDTIYGEAFERNVNVPVKRILGNGTVVLEFCDVNDPKATLQWDLRFNARGRLVAVARERRPLNLPLRKQSIEDGVLPATERN